VALEDDVWFGVEICGVFTLLLLLDLCIGADSKEKKNSRVQKNIYLDYILRHIDL